MRNWKLKLSIVAYIAGIILAGCSMGDMAGGTDTGNAVVTGIIVDTLGNPVANTQVSLIPINYDPIKNPTDTFSLDTTGSTGTYQLRLPTPEGGTFNINAFHAQSGGRLLLQNIAISDDTVLSTPAVLLAPGVMKVVLPDSLFYDTGYVYIPGTSLFEKFPPGLFTVNGMSYIFFDSLPANVSLEVYFGKEDQILTPLFLQKTTVFPLDTVDIESWEILTKENSGLPENTLLAVMIDGSGVVWVGTKSSGLVSYDGSVWAQYNSGNSSLPNDTVQALAQGSDGSIWIGTAGGLAKYTVGVWEVFNQKNTSLPSDCITDIAIDSTGNPWFCSSAGVTEFDGTKWNTTVNAAGKQLDRVYAIVTGTDGNIMIGNGSGLFHFNYATKAWTYLPLANLFTYVTVSDLAVDTKNAFWLTTATGGALKYYNGQWTIYNSGNLNVPSDKLKSIIVDKNDVAWAGAVDMGAVIQYGNPSVSFTEQNTQVFNGAGSIQNIAVGQNNALYFATGQKGLVIRRLFHRQ